MLITVHRSGPSVGKLKQRIEAVGEDAGALAASYLGCRLPSVQVVLTNGVGVASILEGHDLDAAGSTSVRQRTVAKAASQWTTHMRRVFAGTTLTSRGVIIAINGARHGHDLRELDRTLIHELAHAVQLNGHRAREQHIRYLRQGYGLEPRDPSERRGYERLMDIREAQAVNLETLARRLPARTPTED